MVLAKVEVISMAWKFMGSHKSQISGEFLLVAPQLATDISGSSYFVMSCLCQLFAFSRWQRNEMILDWAPAPCPWENSDLWSLAHTRQVRPKVLTGLRAGLCSFFHFKIGQQFAHTFIILLIRHLDFDQIHGKTNKVEDNCGNLSTQLSFSFSVTFPKACSFLGSLFMFVCFSPANLSINIS